jgi:membrane protease YdiL (CAAX protease family)
MELQPGSLSNQPPGPSSSNIFQNEHGLRAGWRLLIFIAIFLFLQLLTGIIVFIALKGDMQKINRAHPTPGFLFTNEFLTFAWVVLATWIMSRIERRPMGEYGLPLQKTALFRFVRGYVFWGFLPLTVLLLSMRTFHAFYFGTLALHGTSILYWAAVWWLLFLFVGLSEEYLLRGYALYTLADGIGFWPASVVLAALFALGHSFNSGETRIGVVMTGLFAIFASLLLWRTGNLWLAVGSHAGWDWAQSYFYGVGDSGLQFPGHLLSPHLAGPDWLSGGSVGPEGSALALLILTLMSIAAWLLYRPTKEPTGATLYTLRLPTDDR